MLTNNLQIYTKTSIDTSFFIVREFGTILHNKYEFFEFEIYITLALLDIYTFLHLFILYSFGCLLNRFGLSLIRWFNRKETQFEEHLKKIHLIY